MKACNFYTGVFTICCFFITSSCTNKKVLETVTAKEFSEFIFQTGYVTDAEKYGWSIVQKTIFKYEVVKRANWCLPNGKTQYQSDLPVTQVSYNDALAYCKWAKTKLPTYEEYWELSNKDSRVIVSSEEKIQPVISVNVIGNTWDITTTKNKKGEIRLAGGSYLCSPKSCDGTNPNRKLFVSQDTGNTHIGFSVVKTY